MFCTKCGSENPESNNFCNSCGSKLAGFQKSETDEYYDDSHYFESEKIEYRKETIGNTGKKKVPIIGVSILGILLLVGIFIISKFLPSISFLNNKSYAVIRSGGSAWIIDSKGKEITKERYQSITSPYKGNSVARDYAGNWKLLNLNGKVVRNFGMNYEYVGTFSEGLARFSIGGKYGYMNKKGKIVIQPIYDEAGDFVFKTAAVKLNDVPMLINQKGESITNFGNGNLYNIGEGYYSYISSYNFPYPRVVNNNGDEVFQGQYDYVFHLGKNYFLCREGNEKLILDNRGVSMKRLTSTSNYIGHRDGVVLLTDNNNKCYFIDVKGQKLIDNHYDDAELFFGGYAVVRENSDYKIIDKKGKKILDCNKYLNVRNIGEGIFQVEDIYGSSFIDVKGKEIMKINHELDTSPIFMKNNRNQYSLQ